MTTTATLEAAVRGIGRPVEEPAPVTINPTLEEALELVGRKVLAKVTDRPAGASEYVSGTLLAVAGQLDAGDAPLLVVVTYAGPTVVIPLERVTMLRGSGAIPSADRYGVPR